MTWTCNLHTQNCNWQPSGCNNTQNCGTDLVGSRHMRKSAESLNSQQIKWLGYDLTLKRTTKAFLPLVPMSIKGGQKQLTAAGIDQFPQLSDLQVMNWKAKNYRSQQLLVCIPWQRTTIIHHKSLKDTLVHTMNFKKQKTYRSTSPFL